MPASPDDSDDDLVQMAKEALPYVDRARKALRAYQAKRLHAWWVQFVGRPYVDPKEVEDEVFAAIAGGDDRVVQAIMEGSRAASATVDPTALPAIALIGRAYTRGEVPAWFQRNMLSYLSSMSADEYGDVRDFFAAAARGVGNDPHAETIAFTIGDGGHGQAAVTTKPQARGFALPGLRNHIHVLGQLKRLGLAYDTYGASPIKAYMEIRVLRWLADTLR